MLKEEEWQAQVNTPRLVARVSRGSHLGERLFDEIIIREWYLGFVLLPPFEL